MGGYSLFHTTTLPSVYSNKSPGWHSSALQMASSVLNRIALAFPVLSMERFASVRSTFSDSSFSDIFRLAIMTSRFTIIDIGYTVNSFSVWISTPRLNTWAMTNTRPAINMNSPESMLPYIFPVVFISQLVYVLLSMVTTQVNKAT